jgi:cyclophilin family peptidyl-prolyl cis-trans isomerase
LTLIAAAAACALAQPVAPAARPDGLYATIKTSMGDITVQLFEKEAPLTVQNFVALAKGTKPWKDPKTHAMVRRPLYNGIAIHRVMADGLIQAGDPTGQGDHDCGVTVKDEIRPDLKFDKAGRLALALANNEPNTGGCQWFITVNPSIPTYDGHYTIFGQVVEGLDVVKAISRLPGTPLPNGGSKPNQVVKILGVTVQRVGPEPAKRPRSG